VFLEVLRSIGLFAFFLLAPLTAMAFFVRRELVPSDALGASLRTRGRQLVLIAVFAIAVGVGLALLASGFSVHRYYAAIVSAAAAGWVFYRLWRRPGLVVFWILCLLSYGAIPGSLLAYDLLSLSCALALAGCLVAVLPSRARLFVAALASCDLLLVVSGLPEAALFPAFLGQGPAIALHPPVYAGLALDSWFLGGVDLAVACYAYALARERRLFLMLYAAAQAALVGLGLLTAWALPATLPSLLALLVAGERRSDPVPVPVVDDEPDLAGVEGVEATERDEDPVR
jgi:hypothetical protein